MEYKHTSSTNRAFDYQNSERRSEKVKMKRDELNKRVDEELKYIPKGSPDQNMLRAAYNRVRRQDLSLNPVMPAIFSLLIKAVEIIKRDKPDFSPAYDKRFFDKTPSEYIENLKVYNYEDLDEEEREVADCFGSIVGAVEEEGKSLSTVELQIVDGLPSEIGGWTTKRDDGYGIYMPKNTLKEPDVYLRFVHELAHAITGKGDEDAEFKETLKELHGKWQWPRKLEELIEGINKLPK
jgi:uncharacterized protein (DUF885 family)